MNRLLSPLYDLVVPKALRMKHLKDSLKERITEYYSALPEDQLTADQKEVLDYLAGNELKVFPYSFTDKYDYSQIKVYSDPSNKMRYVIQDGKRLYFKKKWSEERIRKAYANLLMEQDPASPHRYLSGKLNVESGDVLADIGAGEGNFSLSVIDKIRKAYLFEYNKDWAEALRATFAPWSSKVEIINKFVSDHEDGSNIMFNSFFDKQNDINFLKIDVEGSESAVLKSCSGFFRSDRPLKIALCTYHRQDDEKEFTAFLSSQEFTVEASDGYMIYYDDKSIRAPFLRRGLIRAIR